MDDSLLLKAAVTVSSIGIFCLFVFSSSLEADVEHISALDSMMGERVKVIGEVSSIQSRGEIQVVSLFQESSVEVVVFGNVSEIRKGAPIEVIGTVQKEGEGQSIIAERIRIIE